MRRVIEAAKARNLQPRRIAKISDYVGEALRIWLRTSVRPRRVGVIGMMKESSLVWLS